MTPSTSLPQLDWPALERLRHAFLAGTAGHTDYWQSEHDLASYDATFAQRIGWKWDHVLGELARRGWQPPAGNLLDWGCGSGIAQRAFLDHYGTSAITEMRCWDRSPLAMNFAVRRAAAKYPGLRVQAGLGEEPPVTLLLSHVLSELQPEQTEELLKWLAPATCVLWVEPGDYPTSLALIAIRERLRGQFRLVTPCPHQGRCGILAPGNEPHWCHHFAEPPGGVFTDPFWGKFAQLAGVDLRSLPVSYLVLDKRPAPPLPTGAMRLIGRSRLTKPFAHVLGCDAAGVREGALARRDHPELYRRLRKGHTATALTWECDGDKVQRLEGL
jgi:hypothetical protein